MNRPRCNASFENGYADEALRIRQAAGILDTFKSPQALLDKYLKSRHYTDLAGRGGTSNNIIEQVNGWEEGLVLHNKQVLSARIQSVDVAKQTVEVRLCLPRDAKEKTGWFEPAISVDAKQVAFRRSLDPKCVYLKSDRVAYLQKKAEWMKYDDIVKAIKDNKVMRPFDRFYTDDKSKGEPKGSWTAVRGFLNAFASIPYEGNAVLGGNTNIREEDSFIFGEKLPEECLNLVDIKEITYEEVVENSKTKLSPLILFTTRRNEDCRFGQKDLDGFLFRIRDVDWGKPVSTNNGKNRKTAAPVQVGTKEPATSTLHKISLNVDTTAFHVE